MVVNRNKGFRCTSQILFGKGLARGLERCVCCTTLRKTLNQIKRLTKAKWKRKTRSL